MPAKDNHLTLSEIETILGHATARDLFAAIPAGGAPGPEVAGQVFERAAERQGFGIEALDRVKITDAPRLIELLTEVLNSGGKGETTEGS